MKDIREFHEKYGLEYRGPPRALPPALSKFRLRFLREELKEYQEAVEELQEAVSGRLPPSFDDDVARLLEKALDALVDLVYVAKGTAYLHGFNFDDAWDRVHKANMTKVRVPKAAGSKRKSKYDVVKPPGWSAPRLHTLVSQHAHKDPR